MRLLYLLIFLSLTACDKLPTPGFYCNPSTNEGVIVTHRAIGSNDYTAIKDPAYCRKLLVPERKVIYDQTYKENP